MENDSYPSGHAAIGSAWALVLAQLAPEKAEALARRGYEFGQSHVICGVHWQSDVDAGRPVGSVALAGLQSEPLFQEQMILAKQELASKGNNTPSMTSCADYATD